MWRLWLAGRLSLAEVETVSLATVEAANRLLDAWESES